MALPARSTAAMFTQPADDAATFRSRLLATAEDCEVFQAQLRTLISAWQGDKTHPALQMAYYVIADLPTLAKRLRAKFEETA
jgi:hypothetical protein